MRFTVRRASSYSSQPCDDAVKVETWRWDARTFKTPAEHDAKLRDPWASRGFDHEQLDDGIRRKLTDEAWVIDIPDLDALIAFTVKLGDVIVSHGEGEFPSLEIYDGYRE